MPCCVSVSRRRRRPRSASAHGSLPSGTRRPRTTGGSPSPPTRRAETARGKVRSCAESDCPLAFRSRYGSAEFSDSTGVDLWDIQASEHTANVLTMPRQGAATDRLGTFVRVCREITARPTRQSGEGFRSTRSSLAVRGHHGEVRARRRALPPKWRIAQTSTTNRSYLAA